MMLLPAARQGTTARLDDVPDPLLTAGLDGTVTWLNRVAHELFGAEAAGRPVAALLPFLTEGGSTGVITDRRGRRLEITVSTAAVPEGRLFSLHNITELAEISRLREELLFSVAHELRGPLTVLDGALEMLSTGFLDLPVAECDGLLRATARTAARLHALMDQLLAAGCIQAGRFVVNPRPVALAAILDDATESVALHMEERGLRLTRPLPAADLTVRADPTFARQVVTNLLSNAIKYSPDGVTIVLSVTADAGEALIAISDQGPGIPDDQIAGLFQRFYRPRRAGDAPGIGLGLAIASGIVEAHGGVIGVNSRPGQGTRVWFTLPLAVERPAVSFGADP